MNIVATTLATLYKFALGCLFLLLCWMEMHRYAYLMLGTVIVFDVDMPNHKI
jgi:hypothetical protein